MKKVLFISNIGLIKKTEPNGVNVKNRHILKYLEEMDDTDVSVVDTDNWKLKAVPLFFQIACKSLTHKKIVLSINTNSAYQIIKFLNFMGLEDRLIYFVVGGSLHTQMENGSLNLKYFNNIHKIFVQTKEMEEKLLQLGLKNVEQLPNSKYFKAINIEYDRDITLPIKCFYLGRIHPDKGTDLIFEALGEVNKDGPKFTVDFFGPIEKSYNELFLKKVEEYSFANYEGVIDLIDNVENYLRLSDYDLFLFPTFWHGEGFPGVVLDSFISGVPVLASDWNHNKEVIQDGITGIIFETNNLRDFGTKLDYIACNPEVLNKLRENAHMESKKYHSENVLKVLNDVV